MRLADLMCSVLSELPVPDAKIERLVLDSRQVAAGDVFIALGGTQTEGVNYIDQALARGAAAVLVDAKYAIQDPKVILIPDLRHHLGKIAAAFYGHPAENMRLIGVTGTNGKTSCSHFIAQALNKTGITSGIIGTLGSGLYGALGEVGLTTPDPVTLQALLADIKKQTANTVAMEVSSHSIDQQRINGLNFEVGVFTNLTQDHLDYHGDMETYAEVKHRFLADRSVKQVVLNLDDSYGLKWLPELEKRKPVFVYSIKEVSGLASHIPSIYTEMPIFSLEGIKAKVITPWGEGHLSLPLIGRFNLSNALAVLTTLCVYGFSFASALDALKSLIPVAGRMQMLGGGDKPMVVVDYAHTPDALQNALKALQSHVKGKLICVFGCGGDRDAGKRPQMAAIAEKLADVVMVTNDNPRHEAPEKILRDILQGFKQVDKAYQELDRSKAIKKSIQLASSGDCILIAGKGAEQYQQIGDIKYPFNDVEIVQQYMKT